MSNPATILIVDDEEFNLDILVEYLSMVNYKVLSAMNGLEALDVIAKNPEIELVVLDRMMPKMDGMALLKHIKADDSLKHLMVIMQTAAAEPEQIAEGIKEGVYHYLTKPYEYEALIGLVQAALKTGRSKNSMTSATKATSQNYGTVESMQFRFRTLDEADHLAYFIAQTCPEPARVIYGLHSLMINAIEHGNLGIGYDTKSQLLKSGMLYDEIDRRLALPENENKSALLKLDATETTITITILDEGQGFHYEKYLTLSAEQATQAHGRSIAMAKLESFDGVEYVAPGNQVVCTIYLPTQ